MVIHEGWFEDTIPIFTSAHKSPIAFMHIDCDLYSSTKTIFKHLRDRIVPGTVIVLDEYISIIAEDDERKAFLEFIEETGLDFTYLSRHFGGGSVSVKVRARTP